MAIVVGCIHVQVHTCMHMYMPMCKADIRMWNYTSLVPRTSHRSGNK